MLKMILRGLRSLGAAFAGYMVIVAGTTLAFTVWLGGVGYNSPLQTLILASGGAVLSGLCGGYAAAWLGGRSPVLHALGVLVFLTVDTAFVLSVTKDPLWFELMVGFTLMAATVAGGLLRSYQRRSKNSALSAANLS